MKKHLLLSILIGLVSIAAHGISAPMEKVRKPVVADMFYPSDPHELRRVVNRYLGNVEKGHINGKIVALISPMPGMHIPGRWPPMPISWWRGWISTMSWSLLPAIGSVF